MSQIFFSKQNAEEKISRLSLIASLEGLVTVWVKGSKDKKDIKVIKFDKSRMALVLETKVDLFPENTHLLCTFSARGMNFFSQVIFLKSVGDYAVLNFASDLFKSERRTSFRLMTYPIYDVWAEFNLGEAYQGGKVIDFKSKSSQTALFKNFLNLVNKTDEVSDNDLRIRIQDLSTTGMAIHIGEIERKYFDKDVIFHNVNLKFADATIQVPKVKVVYLVDYVGGDKNIKKFKIGLNFPEIPLAIDELIGKKINQLLRENDFNKDFENFIK